MIDVIKRAEAVKAKMIDIATDFDDEEAYYYPEFFAAWNGDGYNYKAGDRVKYGDDLYKCLQDHTSQDDWKPDVAVSLWVKIDDPAVEWPEWYQPTGAQDAYHFGDKVSHNEKHWMSTVDNNVWEPGVYGWEEV